MDNKCVKMSELIAWTKKNLHKTWYHGKGGGFDSLDTDSKHSPVVKYLRPILDTRDMKIFRIEWEGFGTQVVDFRDDDIPIGETILDKLTKQIQKNSGDRGSA